MTRMPISGGGRGGGKRFRMELMKQRQTSETIAIAIMEDANRLRHYAIARSGRQNLDPKTSMWLITHDAWQHLKASSYFRTMIGAAVDRRARTLMGTPFRVTIDDDPNTPLIQLVMEPSLVETR